MRKAKEAVRVLIADDHKMVRAGLAALLGTEPDIEIVGQAGNGEEAVNEALRLRPDVVIMDLVMPVVDGVAATEAIHRAAPEIRILVLTTFGSSDGIAHALASGATGALMKSADNDDLALAVRRVARGERAIAPDIQAQLKADPPIPELTARQKEILESMVRGLSNPDIARQYGIRCDGVKDHIRTILAKIGASNRTEAVAIALRKHLLKI